GATHTTRRTTREGRQVRAVMTHPRYDGMNSQGQSRLQVFVNPCAVAFAELRQVGATGDISRECAKRPPIRLAVRTAADGLQGGEQPACHRDARPTVSPDLFERARRN